MTDVSAREPASWHPDPLNGEQERWWDGAVWTDLVKPAEPGTDTTRPAPGSPMTKAVPAQRAPHTPPPGWYPDPAWPGQQRWWDGQGWTTNAAPVVPAVTSHSTVVVLAPQKSVGVAFILTFFFSSIGLFYSSVVGGLVMLLLEVFGTMVIALITFGLGVFVWLPLCWIASIVWGCVAASNSGGGGNTTVIQSNYRG